MQPTVFGTPLLKKSFFKIANTPAAMADGMDAAEKVDTYAAVIPANKPNGQHIYPPFSSIITLSVNRRWLHPRGKQREAERSREKQREAERERERDRKREA